MFLQRRVRQVVDSVIGFVSCVFNRLGDVLNIIVDLLFVRRSRGRSGSDEIDKRLNTLNKKGCLVFQIVLLIVSGWHTRPRGIRACLEL